MNDDLLLCADANHEDEKELVVKGRRFYNPVVVVASYSPSE
jgi:hypothetical protein